MPEFGVHGIDLFTIAGESISGWIPSWKMGDSRLRVGKWEIPGQHGNRFVA